MRNYARFLRRGLWGCSYYTSRLGWVEGGRASPGMVLGVSWFGTVIKLYGEFETVFPGGKFSAIRQTRIKPRHVPLLLRAAS